MTTKSRAEEDHHLADLDELLAVDVAGGLQDDEQRVAVDARAWRAGGRGRRPRRPAGAARSARRPPRRRPGSGRAGRSRRSRPGRRRPARAPTRARCGRPAARRPRRGRSRRPPSGSPPRSGAPAPARAPCGSAVAAAPRRTGIRRGSGNHEEPSDGTQQGYPGLRLFRARPVTARGAARTGDRPPSASSVAALAVAATTALIYPLAEVAPVVALGVVYLVAVLLVSSVWGGWLGVRHGARQRAGLQLLPHPADGALHDLRGRELGRARASSSSPRWWPARWPSARACARREAEERRQEADLAAEMARLLLRGDEPRRGAARRRRSAWPTRSSCRRPRSSCAPSRATSGASRCRWRRRPLGTLLVPAGLPAARPRAPARARRAGARGDPRRRASSATPCCARSSRRAPCAAPTMLKTALLRAVSHDLRSPLTAILTAAGALDSAVALGRASTRELVADIAGEADAALAPGRQPARPVAPGGAHGRAARGVVLDRGGPARRRRRRRAAAGHLRARARRRPAAHPRRRRAARARLRQPAGELGALLGGPPGVGPRPRGRRRASSCASSTAGPGVPAAETARIFEPVLPRRRAPRNGHRGSGLGLAIVRGFVEANGGRVWVESLPGQGSSFVVELPLGGPA